MDFNKNNRGFHVHGLISKPTDRELALQTHLYKCMKESKSLEDFFEKVLNGSEEMFDAS